ncbi:MAG: NAD(P)/FAD-dependent oxidoreductase [Thermodesulfobacteriota bacterium]|nr:NAD(P)/FAD-dependent oxidoreductase [Thermodesulfobacteriota bacterium]
MVHYMENWSVEAKKGYDGWSEATKKTLSYPVIKESWGKREFDVVIIGGGPNGLVAGCYLARAGLRVAITDRRNELGGAVVTEVPRQGGFRHNVHAVYMPMVDYAPAYKDLELEKYGLEHVHPEVQFAMSFSDGSSLCIYSDLERTAKSFAKYSEKDAKAYRDFYLRAQKMMDDFIAPATYVQPIPALDQLPMLERAEWHREMNELTEKTPLQFVDDLFENEKIKALMLYVICMWGMDPNQSGVGYLIPLYVNRASNYRLVVHGSHQLPQAMARDFMTHGGRIYSPYAVKSIEVEGGVARGVQLDDGPYLEAKIGVISTLDTQQTFLNLVGEGNLDSDFVDSVKSWMWEHWSLFGVHMCLYEAPQFVSAKDNPDVEKAFVHVLGYETADDFVIQQQKIASGEFDDNSGFNCCFPTLFDPSQAPAGRHTGSISCMVPYNLKEGYEKWLRYLFKEERAWMLINRLSNYAPNLKNKDVVRDIYLSSPVDVRNKLLDMVNGSIKQGQYHPLQMGYLRPNEQCSTHRSPVKGLYMGGACTYPGGTVLLGSGYLAADAVVEDCGVGKWWRETDMVKRAKEQGFL